MRRYEIMLILPAEADDTASTRVTDRITQTLGTGGSIVHVDRWGRRRLAYEIDRQTEGTYLVFDAWGDPASMREMDRVLSLADEVLRFKILVRPDLEKKDERAARKAAAQPEAEPTAQPASEPTVEPPGEPTSEPAGESAPPSEVVEASQEL